MANGNVCLPFKAYYKQNNKNFYKYLLVILTEFKIAFGIEKFKEKGNNCNYSSALNKQQTTTFFVCLPE